MDASPRAKAPTEMTDVTLVPSGSCGPGSVPRRCVWGYDVSWPNALPVGSVAVRSDFQRVPSSGHGLHSSHWQTQSPSTKGRPGPLEKDLASYPKYMPFISLVAGLRPRRSSQPSSLV